MKNLKLLLLSALALCAVVQTAVADTRMALRCEYMETPLCIDMQKPRLMWKIESSRKGYLQKAYRVLVASSPEMLAGGGGDVWDSGKVSSGDQIVSFEGRELDPHARYWWTVEVWGNKGGRVVSEPSWFETSKVAPGQNEWQAQWITDSFDKDHGPSPMFRKEFDLRGEVAEARCYISGLGYYEMYLNGEPVGDHILDPGFTDFSARVLYVTYDITDMLRRGRNAVGVQLGGGWYNEQTPTVWNFDKAPWRDRPRMVCEMRVVYEDGTMEVIGSDGSWKASTGPIRFDNLHVGTTYDARYEQPGWNAPGFDDSKWEPARLTHCPANNMVSQKMPPIGYSKVIKPVSVTKKHETSYVFDMGVNFAGVCRLRISGPKGASVTMKHAEMLDSAGNVDQQNIDMHLRPRNGREVLQTDIYVLKGEGVEEFVPAFTYHGFRYVQVTLSEPMDISAETLEGLVMHSMVEPVGTFECSNELINQIHEICDRSYRSNLFGIPTDCPTREKNGWMADGFMVQEAGMLGYDSRNVYAKWVLDMVDAQEADGNVPGIVPTSWQWDSNWAGPIWDAAIFIVPWQLYQYTGDTRSMEAIYPAAERYLRYLATREEDNGTINHGLGDWLYYKAVTPVDFMGTCYYYMDNMLMARMAAITGRSGEVEKYMLKAMELREVINSNFFNYEKGVYANGTQLSYALPLYLGIAPDGYRDRIAANLDKAMADNDYNLDFGFIGSLIVPDALSDEGYADAVYRMLNTTTMPSYGYWIKEAEATSLFETWDVKRRIGDASLNHPSMGAISAWMYKSLGGIKLDGAGVSAAGAGAGAGVTGAGAGAASAAVSVGGVASAEPAFRKIIIEPQFVEGLEWVRCSYDSQQGRIRTAWRNDGGNVTLEVSIPAGATATVVMPGKTYTKVGSGEHTFTARVK